MVRSLSNRGVSVEITASGSERRAGVALNHSKKLMPGIAFAENVGLTCRIGLAKVWNQFHSFVDFRGVNIPLK